MNYWLSLINLEEKYPIGSNIKTKIAIASISEPNEVAVGTVGIIIDYLLIPKTKIGTSYFTYLRIKLSGGQIFLISENYIEVI